MRLSDGFLCPAGGSVAIDIAVVGGESESDQERFEAVAEDLPHSSSSKTRHSEMISLPLSACRLSP